MKFIKKFAKELSVFGLVLVIFLGLFAYRQFTFKDYKTITESELVEKIKSKEDFVLVLGSGTDDSFYSYQPVLQTYTTKNRSVKVYYVDTDNIKDVKSFVKTTFNIETTYPATIIIKNGEVVANTEGVISYYSLTDFVKENLK